MGRHIRRAWKDIEGNTLVEAFLIDGMTHGVPLGLTSDGKACGTAGPFFLETGISSTSHIAKFWGLDDGSFERERTPAPMTFFEPAQRRPEAHALAIPKEGVEYVSDDLVESNKKEDEHAAHDPRAAIMAAFQAAGLPIPDFPSATPRPGSPVDPAPIIQAALKAAGLKPM